MKYFRYLLFAILLVFVSACSSEVPSVTTDRSDTTREEHTSEASAAETEATSVTETEATSESDMMDETAVYRIIRGETEQVVQLVKEQFPEEAVPGPDEPEDLYRFIDAHKKNIVFASDDEWVLLDRFLILYDPENGLDDKERIRNYREALKFTEAVSEEDKIKLIEQTKEKIKKMEFYTDPAVWISMNGYYYNSSDYLNKRLEPGKAFTIEAKERSELGEGAVMIFCFYRASEEKEWKLINYGY